MGWETQAVWLVPRTQLAAHAPHRNDRPIVEAVLRGRLKGRLRDKSVRDNSHPGVHEAREGWRGEAPWIPGSRDWSYASGVRWRRLSEGRRKLPLGSGRNDWERALCLLRSTPLKKVSKIALPGFVGFR